MSICFHPSGCLIFSRSVPLFLHLSFPTVQGGRYLRFTARTWLSNVCSFRSTAGSAYYPHLPLPCQIAANAARKRSPLWLCDAILLNNLLVDLNRTINLWEFQVSIWAAEREAIRLLEPIKQQLSLHSAHKASFENSAPLSLASPDTPSICLYS